MPNETGTNTNNIKENIEELEKIGNLNEKSLKRERPGLFLDRMKNGDYEISFVFGGIKKLNDSIGKGAVDFVLEKIKDKLEKKFGIDNNKTGSKKNRVVVDNYRVFSLTVYSENVNEEKIEEIEEEFDKNGLNLIKEELLKDDNFEEEIKKKILKNKLEVEIDKLLVDGEINLENFGGKSKEKIIESLIKDNLEEELKNKFNKKTLEKIKEIIREVKEKKYSDNIFDFLTMNFGSAKVEYDEKNPSEEKLKEKFFIHYRTISEANIKGLLNYLENKEKEKLEKEFEKLNGGKKKKHIKKLQIISKKTLEIKKDILKDLDNNEKLFNFLLTKIRKGKKIKNYLKNNENKEKEIEKKLKDYKEYISVLDVIMPLIQDDLNFEKLEKNYSNYNSIIRKNKEGENLNGEKTIEHYKNGEKIKTSEVELYDKLENENYKETLNREGLNRLILSNLEKGQVGSLMFIDIAGMGILNINENEKIAEKLANGEITKDNYEELFKSGLNTTTTFLKVTKELEKKGFKCSLGGDEIFIYKESGEITKTEKKEIADLFARKNLEARSTYVSLSGIEEEEKDKIFINKLFEKLDFLSGINKEKEKIIEELKFEYEIVAEELEKYKEKLMDIINNIKISFYETNLEDLRKLIIPESEKETEKFIKKFVGSIDNVIKGGYTKILNNKN